jgi:hypothetical protein
VGSVTTDYLLIDYLPNRQESCIQGAIEAINTNDPLVKQTISSLEAPSAIAVVRTLFPGVVIEFTNIPEPDPRIPIRQVSTILWKYDGDFAIPAVNAPPIDVSDAVSRIARSTYRLQDWSQIAASQAGALGVPASQALGVMVHPPAPESTETLWDWRFRIQVAAALLAAHLSEQSGSDPLAVLSEIVDGPIDWTTSAALIALLDVALRKADRRREIAALFLNVLGRPPSPAWLMNCGFTAAVACRLVPDLPDGVYARLGEIIEELT